MCGPALLIWTGAHSVTWRGACWVSCSHLTCFSPSPSGPEAQALGGSLASERVALVQQEGQTPANLEPIRRAAAPPARTEQCRWAGPARLPGKGRRLPSPQTLRSLEAGTGLATSEVS